MLRRTILYCDELKKVLVANRGEIACRIFRTCREMNIRTVAVCCESETRAKHVLEADEALILGPSPASTSYLRGDRIIDGCRKLQADAVHPGYGFLSENPEFASAVVASGIKFIGPPPQAMVLMGSKSESKRIMEAAGVPVVPGYYGSDQSLVRLWEEVKKIGFPVLIKAVSGGGGKGMKIVTEESDFELMLNSAKREAQNYFKDDRVLLERYITQPRHIECQIFFDTFGNGVFFFERDCSVQRRYQKVVEEAPAPFLSEEMRGHIGAVALRAAKAVGYVGAGTVEFIFDTEKDEFFFMEMNTRLQVEHPVTEEVCRIKGKPLDLVCLQLQVAAGLPLGFTQEDISMCGVCLETRIYAESPANGFLPMSGKLCYIKEPQQGAQNGVKVRLDTGFRSGDNVLVHYDPMIAKLIVWGDDRRTALEGMRIALRSYHILGVETNIDFLQRCLDNHSFIRGGVTTRFIEDNKAMLLTAKRTSNDMVALGAVALLCRFSRSRNAFWPNRHRSQSVSFVLHGALVAVSVASFADGRFDCEVNGAHFSIVVTDVKMSDDMSLRLGVQLDGEHQFYLTSRVTDSQVALDTPMGFFILPLQPLTRDFGNVTARTGGSARVTSPTPGKVTKFFVVSGTEVKRGQPILILEAMKMEQVIKATSDGKVEFYVQEGNIVGGNHLLAEIVPQDA
ncbi:Biotin carboxylase N terminal domain [Trypanosoma vivax]|nr:putative 3-methylcrotonyl-CoA carboxylase [Trypanosoma vivax]KAH8617601.1 Biotin carboxylase N terminal domain [Trypanosoma vivax]